MKRLFNITSAFVIACVSLFYAALASHVRAEDWPLVRGNAQGTGVAQSSVTDNLALLWTYKAADGAGFDATPVVVDGVIYIGDSDGVIHAVGLAQGATVWTKSFDESSFAAGAAVKNNRLYIGDLSGIVRCLATADGEELWSADLGGEVYAGPMPYGDALLVTSESGTLASFDAADGSERWRFQIDAPLRCTPTIADGRVMLAGCDSLLHIIDATTGKQLQTVEIDGPTGSTPATHGDRVYFGTESGTFFAIDIPQNDGKPRVAWTFRDPRRGQPIRSAAAISDNVVVYGSQGKSIQALHATTGEIKWTVATRTRVESSPVIAGNRVVAATTNGKVYLLDAGTGDTAWEYDAGGNFTASPAIVDGRIILANTDGTLYCFGSEQANIRLDVHKYHEN